MPVKTTIQVRRDTAANWTSTNPTLAAGEIGFESDTNKIKIGNGSSTWTALNYASGAGLTASDTAPASPSVGTQWFNTSTGKTYVYYDSFWVELDSNGTSANGGQNAIINGAFDIWQRGTSFTGTAAQNTAYQSDRWKSENNSTTGLTISQQIFTPGTAPQAGYEGQYFYRYAATSASSVHGFGQPIEDVRTLAGQTITLSFWAKASSSFTLTTILTQIFGSGGSSAVDISTSITIGTSWTRYTWTTTLGSMNGKTIGTNSSLNLRFLNLTNATFTLDFWGVQLEAGSVATPFKRNAPSIQAELAACQRYYWRSSTNTSSNPYTIVATGSATSTTNVMCVLNVPVTMRITPSSVVASNLAATADQSATIAITGASVANGSSPNAPAVALTGTGFTQFRPYQIQQNNNVAGYIEVSAEL